LTGKVFHRTRFNCILCSNNSFCFY